MSWLVVKQDYRKDGKHYPLTRQDQCAYPPHCSQYISKDAEERFVWKSRAFSVDYFLYSPDLNVIQGPGSSGETDWVHVFGKYTMWPSLKKNSLNTKARNLYWCQTWVMMNNCTVSFGCLKIADTSCKTWLRNS